MAGASHLPIAFGGVLKGRTVGRYDADKVAYKGDMCGVYGVRLSSADPANW
jgi:hypothetical protein